jgi:hypothetical protein
MRYRRIVDGEPQYGNNQGDFLQGIDAVAQAISTRLKLFKEEWWEDLDDGLPLWTEMLGGRGTNYKIIEALITQRILDTKLNNEKLVIEMTSVESEFTETTRNFSYTGDATSVYGPITITGG